MSAGANDPHADIDVLCDAFAVALMLLHTEEVLTVPADGAIAINQRTTALQMADVDALTAIAAGLAIMKRGQAAH
jgi:hypothetical protein